MSSQTASDVRPVVTTGGNSNLGLWSFLLILLLGGFWIFSALSSSREAATAPRVTIPASEAGRIVSPPPLSVPSALQGREPLQPAIVPERPVPAPQPAARPAPTPAAIVPPPVTRAPPALPYQADPSGPRVVFERGGPAASAAGGPALQASPSGSVERVEAGRLANPSTTIPQGTVIPAVLETAFDSTRPGGARALVQRDIYSFDGSRILIHRGSRLYGTYEAGINPGERRALIRWVRLTRPDGVTIALDSPASDPLGRAGVEGDVDGRFFARFGGAILQSILDIGVGVATREATDGVIVALPGSTQNVTQATQTQQVRPVLKVDHGTSVSVFVARDLDFASVES